MVNLKSDWSDVTPGLTVTGIMGPFSANADGYIHAQTISPNADPNTNSL